MVLPKVLSPSYWIDKCVKLILQFILALLLQILYIVKGEDARVADVKVTRKVAVSDNKKITQTPARATKPARQSIPVKTGSTGDSSRELKAEEKVTPGTLTELKPDRIEQIKEEEITPIIESFAAAAPVAVLEAQKPEDIVTLEVKEDVVTFEELEPVEEVNVKPIDEPVEEVNVKPIDEPIEEVNVKPIDEPVEEVNVKPIDEPVEEVEEIEEDVKVVEVEIEEAKPIEKVELESVDETESVEEAKPIDEVEPIEEVTPPQLAPLEMKTSHEFVHSVDDTVGEFEFRWKHGGNDVYVTGDFDKWEVTHQMHKDSSGDFVAKVPIDRTKQYAFKFVVDGNWLTNSDLATTRDEHGNENNVIYPLDLRPLHPEYREYSEISSTSFQFTAAAY